MAKRILLSFSNEPDPRDIQCDFTKGIIIDSIRLVNISNEVFTNVEITINYAGTQKSMIKDRWRVNEELKFDF